MRRRDGVHGDIREGGVGMTLKGRIKRLLAAVPPVDPLRTRIPTDPAEILLAARDGRLTFADLRHAGPEHVGALSMIAALIIARREELRK